MASEFLRQKAEQRTREEEQPRQSGTASSFLRQKAEQRNAEIGRAEAPDLRAASSQAENREADAEAHAAALANYTAAKDALDAFNRTPLWELAQQGVDVDARRAELEAAVSAAEETYTPPTLWERLKNIVTGGAKEYGGSMVNTAGVLNVTGGEGNDLRRQAQAETGDAMGDGLWGTFARMLINNPSSGDAGQDLYRQNIMALDDDAAPMLYETADRLSESGAADIGRAQEGLGRGGRMLVQAGAAGVQMGADALLGLGNAMLPMMLRSFGGGAQEARQKGYSTAQQMALGLTSAATEYFTEKLFGGNPVYDSDAGLINKLVGKLVKNEKVLSFLASTPVEMLNEGLEEIMSDILNPLAEWAIAGTRPEYEIDQIIEDGIVGVLLGVMGQGSAAVANRFTGNAQASSDPLTEAAREVVEARQADGPGVETTPAQDGAERVTAGETSDPLLRQIRQMGQQNAASGTETAGKVDAREVVAKLQENIPALQSDPIYLHEVVDGDGNLIYKIDAPTAIKTGVTAESGITGTAEASEAEDAPDGRATLAGTVDTVASPTNLIIPQNAGGVNTAYAGNGGNMQGSGLPRGTGAAEAARQADAEQAAETKPDVTPGLVQDDYVRDSMTLDEAERIDAVAKALGVGVRFVDSVAGGRANAEISGNEILVERGNPNPTLFLLGHEWTHRMQELAPEEYGRFRDAVKDALTEEAKDKRFWYQRNGADLSADAAMDEAVADYAGQMLQDGRILDEFIEAHRDDKSMLRRLWETVREIVRKLTGTEKRMAETAAGKLRAALDAAAEANAKNAAPEGGEARYSNKREVLLLNNVDWMDDHSSIKQQIWKHADKINAMEPVAIVEYSHSAKESLVNVIMSEVGRVGGPAMKNNGISFVFDEDGAESINSHATGPELRAAAMASPYVAKYGKLIAGQKNHEGTGLTTLTFAAPVIINGTVANVGVAIQFQANGKPRAVNVGLQGGGKFKLSKNEALRGTSSRITRYRQGTALDTRSASTDSIRDTNEKSNTKFSLKDFSIKAPDNLTALREENEMLRARAEYWKNQTKVTEGRTLRPGDVHTLANQTIRNYGSTVKAGEIEGTLREVGTALRFGNLSYEVARDKITTVAREIVNNAAKLTNGEELKAYRDVGERMKQPMVISARDANDASSGEWGKWRNAHRGVNVSINGRGPAVDAVYAELSAAHPELFPAEITHPADKLLRMAEIADTLRPIYENPYSVYLAEATEYCANDLLGKLMDESIRETAPTYADRMQWNLEREKARGAEALERERKQRDRQVEAIKKHFMEVRAAQSARKADTEARDKLLRIARRLKNKKLPAVNRTLLNQYIGDLDTTSKDLTGVDLSGLYNLRDWYHDQKQDNPDFIADPHVEEILDQIGRKKIDQLSLQEVLDLTDALLNIENEIRSQRKLIDSEDRRDTYAMGEQVISDVEQTKGSKANDPIRKYIVTETLSPMRFVRSITGWADNDPLYLATKALNDGQKAMLDYTRRAWERFTAFTQDKAFNHRITGKQAEEIEVTGWRRMSVDEKYTGEVKPTDPVTVKITPAMRMSLYLHSLNDQNLRHIRDGGITIPDMKLYKQGKISEAYDRGVTVKLAPSDVRRITEKMTKQERAYAEAARRYFNGMSRDAINEVSEKLKGYSIAQVENYFPITTDKDFSKKEFDALKFDGTIEGMGFLKERQNFAHNPIMLIDMTDVLLRSIDQHARYYGLAIPVRNFSKIWGVSTLSFNDDGTRNGFESSVMKAVKQKWGGDAYRYVEKMMTDLQSGASRTDAWAKALAKVRSNYAGAVLTLNASVAMKQAASYPAAGAVIGFRPLARAMLDLGKVDMERINKYTPLQWYRSQGFSTKELGDLRKQDAGVMGQMFSKKALNWIQGDDVLTTRKLWKAAEYYVRDQKLSPQVGTDAYYNAVAQVYDQIIEETQPNYTTMQLPQLLRSDDTLMGNLAMFKTQPFQNFNILYDAFGNLDAKRTAWLNADEKGKAEAKAAFQDAKKKAGWAVSSQIVQLAVFAGMTFAWNMFRGKRDKYEDEDGKMDVLSALGGIGKDMLGGAASIVPFGSDVWELASSVFLGEAYYGFDAVTASALDDMGNAFIKGGKALADIWKSVSAGEKVNWNESRLKLDSTMDALTKVAGVPFENVTNLFNAVFRDAAIAAAGKYEGTYAYLRLTASPASKSGDYYDNLYGAYTADRDAYERIYASMIESGDFTAEKIKGAMETRMKKAQGVDSVKDLENRYLSPTQQKRYDGVFDEISDSRLWKKADQAARDAAADALYALATENSAGQKMQEKIDGGAAVGLDETEYILYMLARSMVDEPTESGKMGTYTNDEVRAAIEMLNGLTDAERSYLWTAQGKSDKSNPWG